MKKTTLTKFAFTFLASLTLVACGSSGHGDNKPTIQNQKNMPNNKATTPNNKPNSPENKKQRVPENKPSVPENKPNAPENKPDVPNNKPNTPENDLAPLDNSKYAAEYIIFTPTNNPQIENLPFKRDHNGNVTLTVEGQTITFKYDDKQRNEDWVNVENSQICCGQNSYSNIGLTNLTSNDTKYLYYFGVEATQNMPTSGYAHYSGQFLYLPSQESQESHQTQLSQITGKAGYVADFDKKTLVGSLMYGTGTISLQASINGNMISGSASTDDEKQDAQLHGRFFGEKAEELAGIGLGKGSTYNRWGVVFSGRKDKDDKQSIDKN